MSSPRFYCPLPLHAETRLALPEAVAHHALRVLRLPDGAPIVLFNGEGGEYPAVLDTSGPQPLARLGAHRPREAELAGQITLAQGLATGEKMSWVVEKAVELGAHALVPVAARHSMVQLRGERLERRLTQWRRIVQGASEQCGRNRLMDVRPACTPAQLLGDMALSAGPGQLALLCHPEATDSLAGALGRWQAQGANAASTPRLILMVGPEGGWSDEELRLADDAGVQAVRFGARILRTETAGLALVAACTALLGWDAGPGPAAS